MPDTVCEDVAYPLRPPSRLPIRPNRNLRIDVHARATKVRARLVRVTGSTFSLRGRPIRGRVLTRDREEWRIKLPTDLEDGTVLAVDVGYERGAANFWFGLRDVTSCD